MKPNLLKSFYNDEHTREAVKEYLIFTLEQMAIQRVMDRKDTTAIADAREMVDEMFVSLKENYGLEPKVIISNSR